MIIFLIIYFCAGPERRQQQIHCLLLPCHQPSGRMDGHFQVVCQSVRLSVILSNLPWFFFSFFQFLIQIWFSRTEVTQNLERIQQQVSFETQEATFTNYFLCLPTYLNFTSYIAQRQTISASLSGFSRASAGRLLGFVLI